MLASLVLAVIPAGPAQAVEPEGHAEEGWWRVEYVADYLSVGAGLGLWLGLRTVKPAAAGIGPVFEPDRWQGILGPAHSDTIGEPHQGNTVPEWGLTIWAGVGLAGIMVMEGVAGANGLDHTDHQLLHDATLGYSEALLWTLAITEILKTGVGRLRPDFQDRVRRYHCGNRASPDGLCAGFSGAPLNNGWADVETGQRSFVSGHSSTAFAIATYWALVIGGRMVWGKRADSNSMAIGALAQAGLLAAAFWVASTRVADNRHHIEDVVVGSVLGFVVAHAAYWRHFDGSGMPRERSGSESLRIGPSSAGVGVGVSGSF